MGRVQNRRGQSTLEYILVLGVILLAVIGIASVAMRTGTENTLKNAGTTIDAASTKVKAGLGL